jgi:outer membrane immunogenic protein
LTPAEIEASRNRYTPRGSGFTGGAQVGCNWQRAGSPFVLGVEADFNGASLKESASAAYPDRFLSANAIYLAHTEFVTKHVDWFSTYRLRLGYAADRWLVYVTGGLAVARIESSNTIAALGVPFFAGSDSRTRIGGTVGGGLAYAFSNNWSAKVEYLYLDFGTYTYLSPIVVPPISFYATDVHAREQIVRVGLDYKFDWAPVVAKY